MMFALAFFTIAMAGSTSDGSCYDMTTHVVECNVAQDACGGSWYEPGFVSTRSNCCHCKASCEDPSDECDYYDESSDSSGHEGHSHGGHAASAGSCYDMDSHEVTCDVAKDKCGGSWYEPGFVSSRSNCCHCRASCEDPSDECEYADDGEGSCYDLQDTHTVECGVTRDTCMAIDGVWYKPGHISSRGGIDCCHCKAGCPPEGLNDGCTHYDNEKEDEAAEADSDVEPASSTAAALALLGSASLFF